MRQLGRRGQAGEAFLKIPRWRSTGKGVMRPDGVVDALPAAQGVVQASQVQGAIIVGIELFLMRALCPLHMAVELGGVGRQDEEADAALDTGVLEVGLELTPAVDLDGLICPHSLYQVLW